jgi:4-hydroxy-tetrahydrodipicolinate synthase
LLLQQTHQRQRRLYPGPVKAALALMGLLEEQYRLPLVPIQEQTRARVRAVLQELGLLAGAAHVAA